MCFFPPLQHKNPGVANIKLALGLKKTNKKEHRFVFLSIPDDLIQNTFFRIKITLGKKVLKFFESVERI